MKDIGAKCMFSPSRWSVSFEKNGRKRFIGVFTCFLDISSIFLCKKSTQGIIPIHGLNRIGFFGFCVIIEETVFENETKSRL